MRILYLAHRIPYPPDKGDKIRSFHQVQLFSRKHELDLLAFYDDPRDAVYRKELERYCKRVTLVPIDPFRRRIFAVRSLLTGEAFTLGSFRSPGMRREVEERLTLEKFDLIFVYSSSMAQYVARMRIPKVIDFVDSDASKWAQYSLFKPAPVSWLYSLEARRLSIYERDMARAFDGAVFVSRREATHLKSPTLDSKLEFIQNGINLDFFTPRERGLHCPTVVFTGAMDYYPNVDAVCCFAREVLPLIQARNPSVLFKIVGSNPASAVRRLARSRGIEVTGAVPDVRPYLAQATVSVAPLRISQGIQNKVLEALAMGIPVVASPHAAEGINGRENFPIKVAANPQEFCDYILEFIERGILSPDEIGSCRGNLRERFDWETNFAAFERQFERVLEERAA
jgi:sugar transferase (PEP-CTERM/EpsH1 system associated)